MILFYVVYRVLLLSLTKSILEKKRKRAVFHKLIIYNEGRGSKKKTDFEREEKRAKKNHQKRNFMPIYSLAFFHVLFFVLSSLFFNETK